MLVLVRQRTNWSVVLKVGIVHGGTGRAGPVARPTFAERGRSSSRVSPGGAARQSERGAPRVRIKAAPHTGHDGPRATPPPRREHRDHRQRPRFLDTGQRVLSDSVR